MGRTHDSLELLEQLLDRQTALLDRQTETATLLRGLTLNNVLRSELLVIGATGVAHRNVSAPYASVTAYAYDNDITITSGPLDAAPPTNGGIGVIVVPAGKQLTHPLTGREITLFGLAGSRVLLALWGAAQDPHGAVGGAIGGTP